MELLLIAAMIVCAQSHQAAQYQPPNQHMQHGQPQQHGQRPPPMPHTQGQHAFREGARDRQHVLDHLDGVVAKDKTPDQMSEDEVQFHYFKLHDYDDNNRLDGIELASALSHYHKDEDPNNVKPLSDEDLKNLIDTILKEDDRNNDGYIDYAEFIVSQRT